MTITLFKAFATNMGDYISRHNTNYADIEAAINNLSNIVAGASPWSVQTITPADSVTINWSLGAVALLTLDRATTTIYFTGAVNGQRCTLVLKQDGAGNRHVTWPTGIYGGADLGVPPVPSTGANKEDYFEFIYRQSVNRFDFLDSKKGYPVASTTTTTTTSTTTTTV